MSEENFKVTIDAAAPVAAVIRTAATEYKGKYTLNDEAYNRFLNAYKRFIKFALQNDGGFKSIDVYGVDKAKIVAKVPSVDLFRDGLDMFLELLTMIDSIDVSVSKDDDLIIEIGVEGLWKAV